VEGTDKSRNVKQKRKEKKEKDRKKPRANQKKRTSKKNRKPKEVLTNRKKGSVGRVLWGRKGKKRKEAAISLYSVAKQLQR